MFITLFFIPYVLINFVLIPYLAKKLLTGKYDKVSHLVLLVAVLGVVPLLGALVLVILVIFSPKAEQVNDQA
jgi:O-antigen/teichoic acid export membrane protein